LRVAWRHLNTLFNRVRRPSLNRCRSIRPPGIRSSTINTIFSINGRAALGQDFCANLGSDALLRDNHASGSVSRVMLRLEAWNRLLSDLCIYASGKYRYKKDEIALH
jgi:hypothetical protein